MVNVKEEINSQREDSKTPRGRTFLKARMAELRKKIENKKCFLEMKIYYS